MPEPRLQSIEEAMGLTRLSRTTLYTLMKVGRLTYVKIGRRRLIPAQAIAELVAAGTVWAKEGQEVRPCDR